MRKLAIVANWKMNTTPESGATLTEDILDALPNSDDNVDIIICPPFVALDRVRRTMEGSRVSLGAQNVHAEPEGAFTGEVSAPMLQGLVDFVIVGHSERRTLFGESDDFIGAKAVAAVKSGLTPILCVGESLEDRQAGRAVEVVNYQLLTCLAGLDDVSTLLVAYEPVWAIGTGEAATPRIAQDMIASIRDALRSRFGEAADALRCLYGGSVSPDNVSDFVSQPDIDGALVGGASLAAESFASIVASASEAAG